MDGSVKSLVKPPRRRKAGDGEGRGPAPAARRLPNIPRDSDKGLPLLQVRDERRTMDDLIVPDAVRARLEAIVKENRASERLALIGLRPTSRILLCGPPGTGKTLTAGVLASLTGYRMAHVVFDAVVSPYLGETAANMRRVFEFVERGRFVVLFDEFDIVGKQRDDPHEHGEIRRLVGNFMQMLDGLGGPGIVVAATNHPHVLDRALWRRFDEIIRYDNPGLDGRSRLFERHLAALKKRGRLPYGELAARTGGFSAADVARACGDAMRGAVVAGRDAVGRADVERAVEGQRRRMLAAAGGA